MTKDFNFDKFNEWKKSYHSDIRFLECIGAMNSLYKVDKYLPQQYLLFLEFDNIDGKLMLIMNGIIVDVFNLSLNSLYNKSFKALEDNSKFVGLLSDNYDIDYYYKQITELYPDEDIILNVGFINILRSFIGQTPLTSKDFNKK